MKLKLLIIALLALAAHTPGMAQKAALKTNLLSDGFLNPNAAV